MQSDFPRDVLAKESNMLLRILKIFFANINFKNQIVLKMFVEWY